MFSLKGPYKRRPVRPLGLWEWRGWRMKVYGISSAGEGPSASLVEAAEGIARRLLPEPAAVADRYGLGFIIVHEGADGDFVFVDVDLPLPAGFVLNVADAGLGFVGHGRVDVAHGDAVAEVQCLRADGIPAVTHADAADDRPIAGRLGLRILSDDRRGVEEVRHAGGSGDRARSLQELTARGF